MKYIRMPCPTCGKKIKAVDPLEVGYYTEAKCECGHIQRFNHHATYTLKQGIKSESKGGKV